MSTTTTTPAAPVNEFQVIEADIMGFITKVVNEVELLVSECVTALENVAALTGRHLDRRCCCVHRRHPRCWSEPCGTCYSRSGRSCYEGA